MKLPASLAALALAGVTAHGAVIIGTDSQMNGTNSLPHTYTVSASDLLNGLTPTAQAGNFTPEATGGVPALTNGAFPSPITRDTSGAFQLSAFANGGNSAGTSLTYTFPQAVNLTNVIVYGGWQDSGRDQQSYSLLYATTAAPTTFLPLATVNFNPTTTTTSPQVTRVTISDNAGNLASNVKALRFDFGTTENGYSGYAEIDANGTVIPEPGSAVMLLGGLGMVGLLRRRR